jgi:3-hydroxybutyrate dehydrogenase
VIHGKSVVVTGSTSSIGCGIARAFAAEGAHVTLNGFGDQDGGSLYVSRRSGVDNTFVSHQARPKSAA